VLIEPIIVGLEEQLAMAFIRPLNGFKTFESEPEMKMN
jgi:hypothetical protein